MAANFLSILPLPFLMRTSESWQMGREQTCEFVLEPDGCVNETFLQHEYVPARGTVILSAVF